MKQNVFYLNCRKGITFAAATKQNKREEATLEQRENKNTNIREVGIRVRTKQDPNWQKSLNQSYFSRIKKDQKNRTIYINYIKRKKNFLNNINYNDIIHM